MKLWLVTFGVIWIQYSAFSQYYYNDVVALKETNRQYTAIKNAHIRSVTAQSFDADGQPTEGFLLKQEVSGDAKRITTTSGIESSAQSVSVAYYDGTRLAKTVDNTTNVTGDTSATTTSTVEYSYDAAGNIETIKTTTVDAFMNSTSEELHQWFYSNGSPQYMLRIKDKTDTTVVDFVKDEQGNIAEEHWKKRGRNAENYFYYYNDAHLLTDVVRYNTLAKRMLPDFLFSYNDAGLLTELTQVHLNTGSYLVWNYSYNTNGLKQTEACFNKMKEPIGRVEYSYH